MTREPFEHRALIGMDIIRLALERSTTAGEATNVITALIEQYGQGGSCGWRAKTCRGLDSSSPTRYQAIIVETAGHHWVTRNVKDKAAIGNLLTVSTTEHLFIWVGRKPKPTVGRPILFDLAASYIDPQFDLAPQRAASTGRERS